MAEKMQLKKMRLSVFINEPILLNDSKIFNAYGHLLPFFSTFGDYFNEVHLCAPLKETRSNNEIGEVLSFYKNVKIIGLPFYEGENEVVKKAPALLWQGWRIALREAAWGDLIGYNSPSLIGCLFATAASIYRRHQFELIRGNNYEIIKESYKPGLKRWFYLSGYHAFDTWMDVWRRKKLIISLVMGESLKLTYDRHNPGRVHSLGGPVLDDGFLEEPDQKGPVAEWPTLLYVGRLSAEKGVQFLLKAAAHLKEIKKARFCLRIVGDGPEKQFLQNWVAGNDLGKYVHFTGHIKGNELIQEYDRADIFVLPSLTEGMPRAILEAMARKLPVIATRVGGVPYLIEDGKTGVLVDPGDFKQLAEAMYHLLGDSSLRNSLAQKGVNLAATFSYEHKRQLILSIFRKKLVTGVYGWL